MEKLVLVSGGFDPIHPGHIDYLKDAAALGNTLIVGLNSDDWLIRKKGKYFMTFEDRRRILMELPYVDKVYAFDDSRDTAIPFIQLMTFIYGATATHFIFANGGDRTKDNVPEENGIYRKTANIEFVYGIGGGKTRSSSDYLNYWRENKTESFWNSASENNAQRG